MIRNLATTLSGTVLGGITTVREWVHSFHLAGHLVRGATATVAREHATGLGLLSQATRIQATVEAIADGCGWAAMLVLASFGLVVALRQTAVPRPPR